MARFVKTKNTIFLLFLLFGVFGLFFIYMAWVMLKKDTVAVPPTTEYSIAPKFSSVYPNALLYDFEQFVPAEVPLSNTAHSGKASMTAGVGSRYSGIINIPLGDWDSADVKLVNINGWLYAGQMMKEDEAMLVMLISNPSNSVRFSKSIPIRNNPVNRWFRIASSVNTSGYRYNSEDRIRIFLVDKSSMPLMLDDLCVQFGEYSLHGESSPFNSLLGKALPDLNTPPYEPLLLNAIGDNIPVHSDDTLLNKTGYYNILNASEILAGNFFSTAGSNPEILAVNSGKITVYQWDVQKRMMKSYVILTAATDTINIENSIVAKGDFDGDRHEEAIVQYNRSNIFYLFDAVITGGVNTFTCTPTTIGTAASYCKLLVFPALSGSSNEILCIEPSGMWSRFAMKKQQWTEVSKSVTPVNIWNEKKYHYSVTLIPSVAKGSLPSVLTVFSSVTANDAGFALGRCDFVKNNYVSLNAGVDGRGILRGTDRLKTEDQFFAVDFLNSSTPQLLRLRDEWRFDAALLCLNDTSYEVHGQIDFAFNTEIENPKYSAKLFFIPWNNSDGRSSAMFVLTGLSNQEQKMKNNRGRLQLFMPLNSKKTIKF